MTYKILFLAAGMACAASSFAQKDKLREAKKELQKAIDNKAKPEEAAPSYEKAKAAIDLAAENPETKEKAETWQTKAAIYIGMQENSQLKAGNPYREGVAALNKAIAMDKKLATDPEMINLAANAGFYSYNDGINVYNENKYAESYEIFKGGAELLGPDKDKRFILIPVMDTIRAQSKMFMGYTAFYDKKYDNAIAALNEVKGSPYLEKESNIYWILSQAYEAKGDKAQQLATIEEAKKKFPGDKNIENAELNYYISSGKQEEMVKKMEDAVAKDPTNTDLLLNLGIIYDNMAHPKGGAAPPANAAELRTKAEQTYVKAAGLAPDNATLQYQLGAFYFNQAAEYNGVMMNLGTSKEDQKKYNELLVQRNNMFDKALPLLEKSKNMFAAREGSLKGEESKFYFNCLSALKEIYTIQDKLDLAKEMRQKMDSLNQ